MFKFNWLKRSWWQQQAEQDLRCELSALQNWQRLPEEQQLLDDSRLLKEIADKTLSEIQTQQAAHLPAHDNDCLAQLRKERKLLRRAMRRSTPLFQLPFRELNTLLPFITAFFFLSGYLVVTQYLSALGINVPRFFSLADYISSAMNALVSLFMSLAIALLFMTFSIRQSKLHSLQHLLKIHTPLLWLRWAGFFLLILATVIAYWHATQSRPLNLILVTIVYFFMVVFPAVSWRFASPARALFVLSFMAFYGLFVYNTIDGSVRFARSPWQPAENRYRITHEGKTQEYRLLAGNSLYLFVQDRQLTVSVIPLQQISIVEVVPIKAD